MFRRKTTILIILLFFLTLSTLNITPHTSQADVTDGPQRTASTDHLIMEVNTTGNCIWWLLVDDDPYRYQIYTNGLLGSDTYWQDGYNVSLILDYQYVGEYNYTLIASDMADNTATSTIFATITDSASTSYTWSFLIAIVILPIIIFQRRKQRVNH
jgi:hypothetical protein